MEKFSLQKRLTSCRVTKKLVAQVENYLLVQIPRIFKDELASMSGIFDAKNVNALRKYTLTLQDGNREAELKGINDFKPALFSRTTDRLVMNLRMGIPEILSVVIIFPRGGTPRLEVVTSHQKARQKCQQIAQNISDLLAPAATPNWLFHNRFFQGVLTALLPAALLGYGLWRQHDLPLLLFSLGWLVLLALFVNFNLARLFPYVSFETERYANVRSILYLLSLILLNGLVVGYVTLLIQELGRHGG